MSGLSFSLSGGAAHGVVLTGALSALRDRGVIPETIGGISSGVMAPVLAYGTPDRDRHLAFFRTAFDLVRRRLSPRTFLPPHDPSGESTLRVLRPWLPAPAAIRRGGVRSLWAGVATFPALGFEMHELLGPDDPEALCVQVARSSMMPFLTHDTLHLRGGLDGAFRHNHFVPPDARSERWLFTYANKPLTSGRGPRTAYRRVVLLESPFRFALHLDPSRLERAWDQGYRQGKRL